METRIWHRFPWFDLLPFRALFDRSWMLRPAAKGKKSPRFSFFIHFEHLEGLWIDLFGFCSLNQSCLHPKRWRKGLPLWTRWASKLHTLPPFAFATVQSIGNLLLSFYKNHRGVNSKHQSPESPPLPQVGEAAEVRRCIASHAKACSSCRRSWNHSIASVLILREREQSRGKKQCLLLCSLSASCAYIRDLCYFSTSVVENLEAERDSLGVY